jgi:hypothetical protein
MNYMLCRKCAEAAEAGKAAGVVDGDYQFLENLDGNAMKIITAVIRPSMLGIVTNALEEHSVHIRPGENDDQAL